MTMFDPIVEVGKWFLSLIPKGLKVWPIRPNFIMVHYSYMIGMSITCSIILYGAGFIPYIDALFFAVGSSTQSGLNTINVNDLFLYQQITMFFVACVCNPIFINTAVVFVRLYWFEKRFKHIVEDIREKRRKGMRTMTMTNSQMRADRDSVDLEAGVNGREIRVLHDTTEPNGMSGKTEHEDEIDNFKEKMGLDANAESVTDTPESSNKSAREGGEGRLSGEAPKTEESQDDSATPGNYLGVNPSFHRDIKFADELPKHGDGSESPQLERLPEQQDVSKHIEFLQRQQRNHKESTTLRIPGPRAFERGEVPESLSDSDDDEMHRPQTRNTLGAMNSEDQREGMNTGGQAELNMDDHTGHANVKFDEAEHPGHKHEGDTIDRAPTAHSRFGLRNMRSGNTLRHRHNQSQASNRPHISEAKNTINRTFSTLQTALSHDKDEQTMPYLSWTATTGRNSAFLGLTEEQREELGGIEYRSLKTLAKILIIYFIGFHLSGLFVNLPFILREQYWKNKVIADGNDPTWWAIFTSASLFNDLGLTLTPDSMVSFQEATLVLLYGSFLIVIGNTGFPIMLRFVIWVASKFTKKGTQLWEELQFLLDHPRRCFTLLFPSKATWWLFWVLVLLNGVDLIFFIILDLHDKTVTVLPGGFRVLDGWFQATSTRTAGFACVNLYYLHPAIQVSYLIMMYISVFPIAISVRRTNVYEEKSLGIFGGEEEGDDEDPSYVGQHLRRQLSFDLWFLFLGLFIIAIVEGSRISNTNDYGFTMFSVLFEIVSAYGTVGLSLGYPGIDASFSAEFAVISKLVICAMMLRGRHRGLPYALDRAILLPSENLSQKEQEDADRRHRRGSIFAEGHEPERLRHGATWSATELDEAGLPRQHLGHSSAHDQAISHNSIDGGAGHTMPPPSMRRRMSGLSTNSTTGNPRRERSRSLGRVIAGGLSAGPTLAKHD